MTETNINWSARNIIDRSKKILRQYWKHLKFATTSLQPAPTTNLYQPSGTASIVGSPWSTSASLDQDPHHMGRWTTLHIKGKNNKTVTIITAYRVAQTSISQCGPYTAFAQQWHLA